MVFSAREVATIVAALREYFYVVEEGDPESFVVHVGFPPNLRPLGASEVCELIEKLEGSCETSSGSGGTI